jgi:hypothetical protein
VYERAWFGFVPYYFLDLFGLMSVFGIQNTKILCASIGRCLSSVSHTSSLSSIQLMNLLNKDEYYDIISWNSKGTAFKISKPKLFEQEVMPKYFDYIKYSEFSRDLRKWGFIRQKTGEDMGSFLNEKFQKDRWDLLEELAGTSATGGDKSSRALSPKPTDAKDDDPGTPIRSGSKGQDADSSRGCDEEEAGAKSSSRPDTSPSEDASAADDQGSMASSESIMWEDISFPMKVRSHCYLC